MAYGDIWYGTEETRPRIPKEARELSPENLAVLSVLADFQITRLGSGCMFIRTAMIESLKDHDFLYMSEDEFFDEVARLRSEDVSRIKNGIVYAIEVLWKSCDDQKLMRKYFPDDDRALPRPDMTMDFLRAVFEMVQKKYVYFRGTHSHGGIDF